MNTIIRWQVRDMDFGDVHRLLRGPLNIPVRRRADIGAREGVFFHVNRDMGLGCRV